MKGSPGKCLGSCSANYDDFNQIFTFTLNQNAPKKKKCIRGNNKTLRKAIMLRSKSKNRANRSKDTRDIKMYKQQRNLLVRLNKDSKFSYFSNLDIRKESKPFWNACKPYFTNKHSRGDTSIMLVEKEELILSEKKICSIFNTYFGNIVQSLNLFQWSGSFLNNQKLCVKLDKTDQTILKYQHHPNIKMIKKRFVDLPIFNFHAVSVADEKANYRPVSIFPLLSKVYERRMFKQLSNHTKYF